MDKIYWMQNVCFGTIHLCLQKHVEVIKIL